MASGRSTSSILGPCGSNVGFQNRSQPCADNSFKDVAQLQFTMASNKFGRKLNLYRSLREPLGVDGARQYVVITNNPSSIDQNQQLLVRFPNLGKDYVIVPGTARQQDCCSESGPRHREEVDHQNSRQRSDAHRRL